MNQVYKSLWNESTGSYVAVPETAIAAGQQVSSARTARRALGRVQTQRLVLEPRIVFDGALPVAVVDMMGTTTPFVDSDVENSTVDTQIAENPTVDSQNVESQTVDPVKTTSDNEQDSVVSEERALIEGTFAPTNLTSHEIIFIDALVSELEAYITDHPDADVVLIDRSKDGLEQIAAVLAGRTDITAIHILSHGAAGQLSLGNAIVDLQSINGEHADELAVIKAALSTDADILIYGCDVAAGSTGQAFVDALASATGADIAASTDSTGSADLGGDWDLEAQTAVVEAQALALTDWQGELAYTNTSVGGAWAISAAANTAVTPITLTNTTDGITTTVQLSGIANTWTSTATQTLNPAIPAAFTNSASGTADFTTLFNTAGTANATGTITITFSTAVTNPIIHIDRLGGSTNASGSFLTISPVITLTTAGATLTELAGTSHFDVTATTIQQTIGVPSAAAVSESGMTPLTGTAAGSVRVNGTFTTLTFQITAYNGPVAVNGQNTDSFEMSFALDAPPVTNNDVFSVNEDTVLTGNLYANNGSGVDSDVRGDAMTVNRINGATFAVGTPIVLANGTLTITNATTGAFTFTPNANYVGGQTFTYSVTDPIGNTSNTSTTTINVIPYNDTDGDGIVNRIDLDDDNDGILDANEGLVVRSPITTADPTAGGVTVANGAFTTTYTENIAGITLYTATGGGTPFGAASGTIAGFDLGVVAGAVTPQLTTVFAPAVTDLIFSIGDLDLNEVIEIQVYDKNNVLIQDITPYIVYMSNTVTSGLDDATLEPTDVSARITTTNTTSSATFAANAHVDFYLQGIEVSRVVTKTTGGTVGSAELYFISASTTRDTDSDGVADHLDLDSDNDGISDLYESTGGVGDATADTNLNGTVSLAESIAAGATGDGDIDNDGLMDIFDANTANATGAASLGNTPINTDGDTRADYLDLDSDNDGIADTVEARLTTGYVTYTGTVDTNDDLDNDGVVDIFDSSNGVGGAFGGNFVNPVNTDAAFPNPDATPDYRDTDSDGDTLLDSAESGLSAVTTDANGDGIRDSVGASYADPDGVVNNPQTALSNQFGTTAEVAYREYNRVPTAVTDTYSTPEDTAVTLLPLTTGVDDSDPDGDTLTVTSINGTALTPGIAQAIAVPNGTVNINIAGVITFTPTLNFVGTSTFAYIISDGKGGTATANQSITVTTVNDAPVDGDETNNVTEDTTLTVADGAAGDLLNNATDVEGNPLTITAFTVAGQAGPFVVGTGYVIAGVGTMTINANGSYSFAPVANYTGAIPVVTYTVNDGAGGTDTSTLTLTMVAVNDAPVAVDDTATTVEDTPLVLNLIGNDTDINGDTLTLASINGTPITPGIAQTIAIPNGTVTVSTAGIVTFVPAPNYSGPIQFSYTVQDPNGAIDSAVVSVNVVSVNDAPVAVDDVVPVTENTPVVLNLIGNDIDVDGYTLTLVSINGTAITPGIAQTIVVPNGTVTVSVAGVVTFTPTTDYTGPAVFNYEVQDTSGAIDAAVVTVNVQPTDDAVLFEQLLPQPINFAEHYYPAQYHLETLSLPVSMPQDLFVSYSVQESQNQVAKNSALGVFNTDAPTANELNNFTFDLNGLPVGMDPSLFVQHAVRGVPVTPEPNLFVQNAVRQSQAESMARNIGVTSFNTATSGVVSMLNPFEIGSPHGVIDLSVDGVLGEFAKKSDKNATVGEKNADDLSAVNQRAEIDRLIAETVAAEQLLDGAVSDSQAQRLEIDAKQQANKQLAAASFSNQLNVAAKRLKPNAFSLKN